MATPPVTPNPDPTVLNTPNAQGTATPPPALTANGNLDPNAGTSSAPDAQANAQDPSAQDPNATVSNPQSGTPKPAATQSQPNGLQPPTSSTNATSPQQQPVKPLPSLQPAQPDAQHPAVKSAGLLYSIATALAGGPRLRYTVDPSTGQRSTSQVPLSRGDISMAIVSSALSGAFSGLSVPNGPGNVGRAAGAGFGQVQQQMTDADKANQDQAQQSFKDQVAAKNQQAVNLESASRTVLLNSQAEKENLDNSKTLINMDADARQNAEDNGDIQETGVSQADLLAGQKSGKYDPTKQAFYHDGVTTLNGHPEATFTVASNPNRPATLTQEMYDKYASYDIPSFQKGVKIPVGGAPIPQNMLDIYNRQVATQDAMKQESSDVVKHLASSPAYKDQSTEVSSNLAKAWTDPVFKRAMVTALPSVSHSHPDEPLADAVARLGAPYVPDPQNPGKFIPNSGAKIAAAQAIYGGFGGGDSARGKQLLQDEKQATAPTPIKNRPGAESILGDTTSSPQQKQSAHNFIAQDDKDIAAKQAGEVQVARQRADATAAAGGNTPQNAIDIAKSIERGESIPTPTMLRSLYKEAPAVEAQLARDGFNLAQANLDYQTTGVRLRSLNSTGQVRVQQSTQRAYDSLPLLQQKYDAWVSAAHTSGYKAINAGTLATMKQLPGAAGAAANLLDAQISDMTSDLGNMYMGGNSPTDHGLELAGKNFNSSWNQQTFEGAISQARQNIQIRINSINNSVSPVGVSANSPYLPKQTTTMGSGSDPNQTQNQAGPTLKNGHQYLKVTTDGKQGWDGKQWVATGNGSK